MPLIRVPHNRLAVVKPTDCPQAHRSGGLVSSPGRAGALDPAV